MVCCKTVEGNAPQTLEVDTQGTGKVNGRCCKPSCATLFCQITLVAGVVVGIFGTLALLSLLLRNAGALTPFFQKVSATLGKVAIKLGCDPMALAVVTTSTGGALVFGGGVGWRVERWKSRELYKTIQLDTQRIKKQSQHQQANDSSEINETPT